MRGVGIRCCYRLGGRYHPTSHKRRKASYKHLFTDCDGSYYRRGLISINGFLPAPFHYLRELWLIATPEDKLLRIY